MRQFVERGYEVTIVCADTETVRKEKGDIFRYVDIPMRRGMNLRDLLVAPFRFLALFRREKFDLIQYTTPNASLYASLGAWMAGAPRQALLPVGLALCGGFRRAAQGVESLGTPYLCPFHRHQLRQSKEPRICRLGATLQARKSIGPWRRRRDRRRFAEIRPCPQAGVQGGCAGTLSRPAGQVCHLLGRAAQPRQRELRASGGFRPSRGTSA